MLKDDPNTPKQRRLKLVPNSHKFNEETREDSLRLLKIELSLLLREQERNDTDEAKLINPTTEILSVTKVAYPRNDNALPSFA
jgi:hypothetical protein